MTRSPHEQLLFAILRVGDDLVCAITRNTHAVEKNLEGYVHRDTAEEIWERVDEITAAVKPEKEFLA